MRSGQAGAPVMTMGSAAIAEQFGLFLSNIHLESEDYRWGQLRGCDGRHVNR
jgi:hypothetical protein